MGQIFGVTFVCYLALALVFMPMALLDHYLKNRDCRVKHSVDVCQVIHVPEETP